MPLFLACLNILKAGSFLCKIQKLESLALVQSVQQRHKVIRKLRLKLRYPYLILKSKLGLLSLRLGMHVLFLFHFRLKNTLEVCLRFAENAVPAQKSLYELLRQLADLFLVLFLNLNRFGWDKAFPEFQIVRQLLKENDSAA